MQNHLKLIILLSVLFVAGCKKTPNPNEILQDMALGTYPPWKSPQYSYEDLLEFFPTSNYVGLTSFYVSSSTGTDQPGYGTTSTSPFKTIQYAIDQVAKSGVIIRVMAGTYYESVDISKTIGTKDKPFVLYSENGHGAAIIDGQFQNNTSIKSNGQYVVIDGFEVKNANLYSILISGPGQTDYNGGYDSYSVVRKCHIHHAKSDIMKVGSVNFVLIEFNDIHDVQYEGGEFENCIDGVGVYHTICRFNYLHDNKRGGGGYFKAGSANNIWCYNLIKDMVEPGINSDKQTYGIQIGGSGRGTSYRDNAFFEYPHAYGQVIFNNIFINCASSGIHIINAWESKIFNNTFYNCGYVSGDKSNKKAVIRTTVNEDAHDNGLNSKNLRLYNNVAYNESGFDIDQFFIQVDENEFTSDNFWHETNLIFNSSGVQPTWGYSNTNSSNEIIADPMFTNPNSCDFSYSSGSPAIGSGKTLYEVLQGFLSLNCDTIYSLTTRNTPYDLGAFQQ